MWLGELLWSLAPAWAWAQAFPLTLAVRALLALLVLSFLYRSLGEPGEGWTGSSASVTRRSIFALLGAWIFFTLTANWVPEERGPGQGRGFQSAVKATYSYRLSFSRFGAAGALATEGEPRQSAVRDLRKAVEQIPESAFMRRYLGIVLAERGDYREALASLQAAMDRMAERAPERAAQERRLWTALFGPQPASAAQIEAARGELASYQLGWIGKVAILAAYQRLGPKSVPPPLREELADEATAYFQRLMMGGIIPLLLVPQLGLISLVVGGILIGTRVARPVPRDLHPVNAILWESFILMMALGMAPALWAFGGQRPAPETRPGVFAALLLLRDAFQLLAILYLWWRLRGRGLGLSEIGLTRRHLGANILVGVMAAVVLIPTAYLVGIGTQFISDRFFPNIAPPYHPLQGLTATSGSIEIRAALFTAAVIGAPLLEEIFFRGALFGALRRRFGFWPGLLGSSAFFAILHPQLPLGFLPIAVLGAAFAVLYDWRQSLVPAMVAHALNNGLSFLMLSLVFPRSG